MTRDQVLKACRHAEKCLLHSDLKVSQRGRHVHYMIGRIPAFIAENRTEKAMRWLGFVQGYLWANNLATIEDMKKVNSGSD